MTLRTGGFATVTASARVTVQEKPKFFTNSRTELFGNYGSEIRLPCDVEGIPKPNITWYRNAEVITDQFEKRCSFLFNYRNFIIILNIFCFLRYFIEQDNALLIKTLHMSDNGMFQCFARNEAGESSVSFWLRVKSK